MYVVLPQSTGGGMLLWHSEGTPYELPAATVGYLAAFSSLELAMRVRDLLERHGLVDVPLSEMEI